MSVYGMCGFLGSGKNTVAATLQQQTGALTHSFAQPLKDAVSVVFGWDRAMLEGDTPESREWREQPDAHWSSVFGYDFTPRYALQYVGTELFRNWQSDIWVESVRARLHPNQTHIVTDARFRNEMALVRSIGGTVVWVYRPNTAYHDTIYPILTRRAPLHCEDFAFLQGAHSSETMFLREGADLINVVIENTGPLTDMPLFAQAIQRLTSLPDYQKTTYYLSPAPFGVVVEDELATHLFSSTDDALPLTAARWEDLETPTL